MGIIQEIKRREHYIVYTEDGEPIRVVGKEELHRLEPEEWLEGATCFVINEKGEILLEKRGKNEIEAGMLDLCSGHVNQGEMAIHTIVRELKEELNIPFEKACNVKKLQEIDLKTTTNQNFSATVYALLLGDYPVEYKKEEIETIFFKPRQEVYALFRNNGTRIQYSKAWETVFEKIEKLCEEKLERKEE